VCVCVCVCVCVGSLHKYVTLFNVQTRNTHRLRMLLVNITEYQIIRTNKQTPVDGKSLRHSQWCHYITSRSEVLTVALVKIRVFWDVMQCRCERAPRRFEWYHDSVASQKTQIFSCSAAEEIHALKAAPTVSSLQSPELASGPFCSTSQSSPHPSILFQILSL